MARKHAPYAPEFRRQMIELVRAGRTPEELAKEFEPSAQAIRNWVAQADRDEGRREDGLTTVEREELNRTVTDAALIVEIRAAHAASKGTYGAPRIQIDLADAGIRVSRKRIARLMRNAGLAGVSRRKGTVTTVRDGARQAPDLVDRNFTADRPNMLWVADITYIPTWAGFLYLAVVLDAFSRRIVGWSMAITLHTRVVLDALNMALWQRRPSGVIHHSDSKYGLASFRAA
jgi:putative transposase